MTEENNATQIEGNSFSIITVDGMDTVLQRLETLEAQIYHPMLTTPFEQYTVTEGLLLLILLFSVISVCIRMLKGGFSWLLW